ncbi:sodium:solute symporter family protein [Novosphingobium sp. 9]|uniref:sodium:solute symporter family protein n=1 Tax=Novosphingobium sp. 9 TaxID=2025349 RepID=UPI0021B4D628|nr:sodium:solute symporter family protein [Novosphingobium sp. 9]
MGVETGADWFVIGVSVAYMVGLAFVSYAVRRNARTAKGFTSGGTTYPAIFIGFMLMSEFIGTTASVGTAQQAYTAGVSAAWNVAVLGIGFLLYAWLLARKFNESGENTISAAMAKFYGNKVKLATSIIMICALQIVAISTYGSGGAVLAPLLSVDRSTAIIITGVVAVLYVSLGGMSSVIYTNVIHAILKYVGVLLALGFAIWMAGGTTHIVEVAPAKMFSISGVGWDQVFAWLVAGVGAVFSTQYVVQAISTVPDGAKATRASFYAAVLLVPFGIAAALIGVAASVAFPGIKPLQAFPEVIDHMGDLPAAIVVAGLAGSLFGTISALSIGTATLIYKDFYLPITGKTGDDRSSLMFVRVLTIVVGLLPIPLAIMSTQVVAVTFLAKSLRAALAVLVLLMFYAPRYGSKQGAFVSIILSLLGTIAWYLAGNPFGIDNAFIAVGTPIVVMTISHFLRPPSQDVEVSPDAPVLQR